MRKRLTKKQNQENGRRLKEANERVRRDMTRRALYGAEYLRETGSEKEASV